MQSCTCQASVNSPSQACESCQAEWAEWCQSLEASGIIGPYETAATEALARKQAQREEERRSITGAFDARFGIREEHLFSKEETERNHAA